MIRCCGEQALSGADNSPARHSTQFAQVTTKQLFSLQKQNRS
jgi:hypothetical protein